MCGNDRRWFSKRIDVNETTMTTITTTLCESRLSIHGGIESGIGSKNGFHSPRTIEMMSVNENDSYKESKRKFVLYWPETAMNIDGNGWLESTSEHVILEKQTRLVRLISKRNREIIKYSERVFSFRLIVNCSCPIQNLRCGEIVRSCERKIWLGLGKGYQINIIRKHRSQMCQMFHDLSMHLNNPIKPFPMLCLYVKSQRYWTVCSCIDVFLYTISQKCLAFLVADTQLYKRLCPSVGWLVDQLVGWSVCHASVEKWENAHFRPCPPVCNWWPCIRPC